jgi:hypothetical protein
MGPGPAGSGGDNGEKGVQLWKWGGWTQKQAGKDG